MRDEAGDDEECGDSKRASSRSPRRRVEEGRRDDATTTKTTIASANADATALYVHTHTHDHLSYLPTPATTARRDSAGRHIPSATGTTADASALAHITRQWLRTAHQAVRYLRAGAASLRVSSASTDHPSSGDHASAPGCLAIQPSVGQCVDASAHANIHAPMTRPARVHRCQKVGEEEGTEAGSGDGDAGDAGDAAASSVGARASGSGRPRRKGTPPRSSPTPSQKSRENLRRASSNVGVSARARESSSRAGSRARSPFAARVGMSARPRPVARGRRRRAVEETRDAGATLGARVETSMTTPRRRSTPSQRVVATTTRGDDDDGAPVQSALRLIFSRSLFTSGRALATWRRTKSLARCASRPHSRRTTMLPRRATPPRASARACPAATAGRARRLRSASGASR